MSEDFEDPRKFPQKMLDLSLSFEQSQPFFKEKDQSRLTDEYQDHLRNDYEQIYQCVGQIKENIKDQRNQQNRMQEKIQDRKQINYIFFQMRMVCQDRNVLKFIGRLFMKYYKKYSPLEKRGARLRQVRDVFDRECQNNQGKITLNFFKILFNGSQYSEIHRYILFHILGDYMIMKQKVFDNGNVKKKCQYLYACKLMRLRCKSGILCERAQSR